MLRNAISLPPPAIILKQKLLVTTRKDLGHEVQSQTATVSEVEHQRLTWQLGSRTEEHGLSFFAIGRSVAGHLVLIAVLVAVVAAIAAQIRCGSGVLLLHHFNHTDELPLVVSTGLDERHSVIGREVVGVAEELRRPVAGDNVEASVRTQQLAEVFGEVVVLRLRIRVVCLTETLGFVHQLVAVFFAQEATGCGAWVFVEWVGVDDCVGALSLHFL